MGEVMDTAALRQSAAFDVYAPIDPDKFLLLVRHMQEDLNAAADRIDELEQALERIASCEQRHPDDVVAVARAALAEARTPA